MMNSPEISIIVAVYKAENYIRRCLESIRSQTFTDFEVLLIDDGSPDKSGDICDEYAALDSRFRVIHKDNGGVSSARQCGVDNAIGRYSIHVDPDDWVEPDYLEVLYSRIMKEDADMCCCGFIREYRNKSINFLNKEIKGESNKKFLKKFLKLNGGYLFNKLIRHKLYKENNITFPENVVVGEDMIVMMELIPNMLKIVYTDRYLYHYDMIINENSLCRVYDTNRFKKEEDYLRGLQKSETVGSIMISIKDHIGNMAHNVFLSDMMSYAEYVSYFRKYFFDIMTSSIPIWRKVNIFMMFIGLGNVLRPIYLKIKNLYLNG